jgi:hypothetical protein
MTVEAHATHRRETAMARSVRFKQADVQRALRAAKVAGVVVASYRIEPDGAIVVVTKDGGPAERDELEEWRARRDARKAMERAMAETGGPPVRPTRRK